MRISLEHLKFFNHASIGIKLEVYCKVGRLRTGLTVQQSVTMAQWDLNKTPLGIISSDNLLLFKLY